MQALFSSIETNGARRTVNFARVEVVGDLASGCVNADVFRYCGTLVGASLISRSLSLEKIALSSACGACDMQWLAITNVPRSREVCGSDKANQAGTESDDERST